MTRLAARIIVLASLWLAAGCLDPLVGAECAPDREQCGGTCVDLSSDPNNCGACGVVCDGACVDGFCTGDPDDVDVGPDAGVPVVDADPDPGSPDAGSGSGGSDGGDGLVCLGDDLACGGQCIDPLADPLNCGACGNVCASGICLDGSCPDDLPGHVILIGHDYTAANPAIRRVLGNAVFTAPRRTVRVLVYEGSATQASISGADAAIDGQAARRGRSWRREVATSAYVPSLLASTDVLLVHAQATGDDASLAALGADWQSALDSFLDRGGVMILLDGPAPHAGTHQISNAAGLTNVSARAPVSSATVEVVAPTDGLATNVPLVYAVADHTVWFDAGPDDVVIADGSLPVVIHQRD